MSLDLEIYIVEVWAYNSVRKCNEWIHITVNTLTQALKADQEGILIMFNNQFQIVFMLLRLEGLLRNDHLLF